MLSAVSSTPQCRTPPLIPIESKSRPGKLVRFSDLTEPEVFALDAYIENDADLPPEWDEADVVKLCWVLLRNVECLRESSTPLIEKIMILNWIFTDPEHFDDPFSFDFCVKAVCLSPHSELPYIGDLKVDDVRELFLCFVRTWMRESAAKYPQWMLQIIKDNPCYAIREFEKDSQWLNNQVKKHEASTNADLFDFPV